MQFLEVYLKNIEQNSQKQVSIKKSIYQKEKHLIQPLSIQLNLDGLLAHTSVQNLISNIKINNDLMHMVPSLCDVQYQLLMKEAQRCQIQKSRNNTIKQIENNKKNLMELSVIENRLEQLWKQNKCQLDTDSKLLDQYQNEGLKLLLNHNKKLKEMIANDSLQQQQGMYQNEQQQQQINEIQREIQNKKNRIKALTSEYCGQEQFPTNKTQAMSLLNKLDSKLQSKVLLQYKIS